MVRSRELGEGLRRAMEQAELTGKQAARQLDLSPSWVSRAAVRQAQRQPAARRGDPRAVPVTGPERGALTIRLVGWQAVHRGVHALTEGTLSFPCKEEGDAVNARLGVALITAASIGKLASLAD
jgi:hypothetical protein